MVNSTLQVVDEMRNKCKEKIRVLESKNYSLKDRFIVQINPAKNAEKDSEKNALREETAENFHNAKLLMREVKSKKKFMKREYLDHVSLDEPTRRRRTRTKKRERHNEVFENLTTSFGKIRSEFPLNKVVLDEA